MNFTSVIFLFYFLPVFIALYYAVKNQSYKNYLILAASLFFYAWGEGFYLLLLIGSVIGNHFFAQIIDKAETKKLGLAIAITANLGLLLTLKYGGFIGQSLGLLQTDTYHAHLPLGISFFTFQAMSMLIDVYRGQRPMKSLAHTGIYITMFPQLIAGPIVRFNDIKGQIIKRDETVDRFASGVKIFILGLAQKVLIANVLAGPVDVAFSSPADNLSLTAAWIGIICFSFQIYYDFAGYSNMAIGIGRMIGFELPQNFNYPYSAKSFQEFWRRWHITLSRWFRDYLYIPLGGSRTGAVKTYRNLLIVFILCGFWHGAAWTFLLWGLWHGAFLILERKLPAAIRQGLHTPVIGSAYLFFGVTLGWVLFRSTSLAQAVAYWKALMGLNLSATVTPAQLGFLPLTQMTLVVAVLAAWQGWEKRITPRLSSLPLGGVLQWGALYGLLILSMIYVAGTTHQPFIYFRF